MNRKCALVSLMSIDQCLVPWILFRRLLIQGAGWFVGQLRV